MDILVVGHNYYFFQLASYPSVGYRLVRGWFGVLFFCFSGHGKKIFDAKI